jgi:protein-S-isoprenylcysteine O-methyltransferase Ste14
LAAGDTRESGSRPQALAWAATAAMLATVLTGLFVEGGSSRALAALGLAFAVVGIPLAWWPMFTLRRHGLPPEDGSYMDATVLVERGPFRLVRHPQYLGYICFAMTLMLAGQQRWVLASGLAAIVFFYAHARAEERELRRRFGEAYERYASRVPGFNLPLGVVRWLSGHRRA